MSSKSHVENILKDIQHGLSIIDLRIISKMPQVRRIEEVVQENQSLFKAVPGDVNLKVAANYLEKVAEQNEESATSVTTLDEYARSLGTMIEYSVNSKDQVCAALPGVFVKEGPAMAYNYGRGPSAEAARQDYINQVQGKWGMVDSDANGKKREFAFPTDLSAEHIPKD